MSNLKHLKTLTKPQAKKFIREDLTPRYEIARDSAIKYVSMKAVEYRALRLELNDTEQSSKGVENPRWRELYSELFEIYNKETKRMESGLFYRDIPKKYQGLVGSSDKTITKLLTEDYKKMITNVVEAVYSDIKEFNPKSIEAGRSEHDINFTLGSKDGKKQSYTINTIVAGGFIQVIHNRTLRKLHNGIVA